MPIINFICKKCEVEFDFDVGRISFEFVDWRPQFERKITCPNCGILTLDEVELTEIGQSQLTYLYMREERGNRGKSIFP